MTLSFMAVAFTVWCGLSAMTHAQSLLHPEGLNPGDKYRLIFITGAQRDGLSSDIADYNAFVMNEANAPNSLVSGLHVD